MKKKSVTRVFLLSLLFLAVAVLALVGASLYTRVGTDAQVAEAEDLPIVRTGNVEVLRGKYFTVDVILENNTLGLTSLEIGLDYDPTVMSLVAYDTRKVLRGSALSSLGFNTSNFDTSVGMNVRPVQFLWNGQDADYSNGTLVTLRFKSVSSSDPNLLGEHFFTLTYKAANTFRTTTKAEGGHIIYQAIDLQPGYVDITAGKFQCTYFDWNGAEVKRVEENDFSQVDLSEPAHPARPSDRLYYYTYTEDQWEAAYTEEEWENLNNWQPGDPEPEGFIWNITALYTPHAQPYTVYYYFGEKDPETGVITMGETAEDYYYTWDTTGETPVKEYCEPKTSVFGGTIILPAQYTEAYYSLSPWYTDSACTEELAVGLIPEDTSVSAATVAALPVGEAAPVGTFKLKLYAYRQENDEIFPPEDLEVNASKLENVVTVADTLAGPVVTVDITLSKNFGIMSMLLTLDYDRTCLTLTNVTRGEAFPSNIFSHSNVDGTLGYDLDPYILYWENSSGNYYGTGVIATLTFTLDPDATLGDHVITLSYTPKQDVTRYYDNTTISGTPVPAMLWYTTLNIVDGCVTMREVAAPTEHEGNYYFNQAEQTYTFATNGDIADYDIVTSITRKWHGSQPVTVSLKKNDNVYRFWQAAEGRPRGNKTYTFEILKRSVAIPQASTVTYFYNHKLQTYHFSDVGDAAYYVTSNNFTRTLVGTQTITCTLIYPEDSYWGENEADTDDKNYDFEIRRLRVAVPVSAGNTYTYDTTEQTYAFSTFDTEQTYYTMPEGADKRTVSGSQTITVTLKDTANYCWDEQGDSVAAKTFNFTVAKRSIIPPTETTENYIYNGNEKTYLFASEPQEDKALYYSVTNNTRTVAGSQDVTVALLHKGDTYWGADDTDTADKTYLFTVEKMTVIPPTASTQTFTFDVDATTGDPVSQEYQFSANPGDTSLYTVDVAAMTKSDSGTTQIAVTLKDTANYKWSTTGLSTALSYDFHIAKKAVVQPVPNTAFTDGFEYDGTEKGFYLKPVSPTQSLEPRFYTVTNNFRTNAGTYTGDDAVKITLKYPAHSYWAGSDPVSSEQLSYDFVIAKKQVTKPTAHSGEYRYTGEEQTYSFGSAGDSSYYTATGTKRTIAGSQTVTVTLGDNKSNYAWKSEAPLSSDDLEFTFEILPQRVTVPQNKIEQGSPKVYTFTGGAIQAEFNSALQTDLYTVTGDSQTASGTHAITFTLKLNTEEQKNYCWTDDTFAPKSIDFVIKKRVVTAPTGVTPQTVPYSGAAQSYVFSYEDTDAKGVYYTCSETSFTNAGEYTVTCALVYPEHSYWSTGTDDVANKTFAFNITKKVVEIITIAPKDYNGDKQTSGLTETDDYFVTEDEGGTDAGDYTVTVKLKNANYRWSDGSEALERTFPYHIDNVANAWLVDPAITGWTYGEAGNAGTATPKFGETVIKYRVSGASVDTGTTTLPTTAGNYVARFSVPATASYSELLSEKSFRIEQATLDMSEVVWLYPAAEPFVYSGGTFTVTVDEEKLPDVFKTDAEHFYPEYSNNTAVDSGDDYVASVIFRYDAVNYVLDFKTSTFVNTCPFSVAPCEVEIEWGLAASYIYKNDVFDTPTAKYKKVNGEYETLTVEKSGTADFLTVGDYHFSVVIENANYVAAASDYYRDITVLAKPITKPTADATEFVYDGTEKTYVLKTTTDSDWYTVSDVTRTVSGSQDVTVDLIDKANTYWAGTSNSVAALTFEFDVAKRPIAAPTADETEYVFDGNVKTYTFKTAGDSAWYTTSGATRTASGSQTVTVALNDKTNTYWAGTDEKTTDVTFTFAIAKRSVIAPTADTTTYVYDGVLKTYTLGTATDSAWYTASNTTRTASGSQTVTVALNDKTNTYWAGTDEKTDDKNFPFSVAQATVIKPTADETAFVYDGTHKTYTLGDTEDKALYIVSENATRIKAGSENITVTLKDPDNYHWADGDSEPLRFAFVIAKRPVTAPTADETAYVYNGSVNTYTLTNTADSAWYAASNTTRTDAGNQTVTVALNDKTNTYWAGTDEKTEDVIFTFSVAKAEATPPTASAIAYTYDGTEQSYVFAAAGDKTLYTVGAYTMMNAGSMDVTVSLVSPLNYRWKGTESSETLVYVFTIAPAKVVKPAPDETDFRCNGKAQTYVVAASTLYGVSGNSKSEHGTTNVVISLKDKNNYVWDNAPEADSNADILYPFTIEHDYKNKYVREEYKVAEADCTHGATYYFVCDCGAVGTETYESGDPLGHAYVVVFDWGEPETVDGADSYSEVYANITCSRCDHEERVQADLDVEVTLPGKANGLRKYTASVLLDRTYSESKEVVLKAIYHNYGDPVFSWTEHGDGTPTVVATFPCIDEGAEHLKIEVEAEVTVESKSDTTFEYVATAYFYEKAYVERSERDKPVLTFIWGEAETVMYWVLPGQNITDLIPAVPEKEGAVFLKWWESDSSISLVYTETGYTPFVMRNADRTFVAKWKIIGMITVLVTDVESNAFEGCVVELKQGDVILATSTTDESGNVVFYNLDYGNYTVVVTYTGGTKVTYTTGVLLGEEQKSVFVQMSEKRFNTEVNDEDNKNISVENLENTVSEEDKENIVTAGQEGDVTEITVVLSVINETNEQIVEKMTEWIESQNNEVLDLSDITLVKTVKVIDQNGEEVATDSTLTTSDELVDITFPLTDEIYAALAAVHGNVENLVVAKKDGETVSFMTKHTEEMALASDDECFYVTEEDGIPYVVVRTKTFSTTYGLCVNGDPVGATNSIISFEVHDWTYGETPVAPEATAEYGEPFFLYFVNNEWVTDIPTAAGAYPVKAIVEATTEYNGVTSETKIVTIRKASYNTNVRFEGATFVYDGEVHSLVAEGVPEGVTVQYENNGQVDVGEYVVTVTFVGDPNYEVIPAMTATLSIVEKEEDVAIEKGIIFWILLAIALAEMIASIILLLRSKKYKKKYEEAKAKKESMGAFLLLSVTKGVALAVNIVLLVLDVILLGLLIWTLVIFLRYKKKYKAMKGELEAAEKTPTEEAPAEETQSEETETNAPSEDENK